jgi:hypothetical protein
MTRIFFKYIKKISFKILKNKIGPTSSQKKKSIGSSFNDFTPAVKKKLMRCS